MSFHQALEEKLGGIIGGDTGGNNAAHPPAEPHDLPFQLGKDCVSVDIPPAT